MTYITIMKTSKANHYAAAGVDLERSDEAKERIGRIIASTRTKAVLHKEGAFGGLFDLAHLGIEDPVLCSSIDSVGTKLELAYATGRHEETAGDIVRHGVNDILVLGAEPLFFLDYIGIDAMDPDVVEGIVRGLAKACKDVGCALVGGETAVLPGLYPTGKYDLAGCIVGVVSKKHIIDGSTLVPGDVLLGLPSTGLHTNGYSLARKVFFPDGNYSINETIPEAGRSVTDLLLDPHRCYLNEFRKLRSEVAIKAMCHITGGGFEGNLSRVLPEGVGAVVDVQSWKTPILFREIERRGGVSRAEMYRVFNMGIGFIFAVAAKEEEQARAILPEAVRIGNTIEGEKVTLRGW